MGVDRAVVFKVSDTCIEKGLKQVGRGNVYEDSLNTSSLVVDIEGGADRESWIDN